MSGFEYLFTFYGLLLGLAIANVTTGFADMWRSRDDIETGWTTPLLGLFVLLAAAQQWVSFWGGREFLTMEPWNLTISMGVALPYIFISRGMFPRQQDKWRSLEDYYAAHSRVLMGMLMVPSLTSLIYNGARSGDVPEGLAAISYVLGIGIPLSLVSTRRPWAHRMGLSFLCAWMLFMMFADFQ
jgi:hypothetical protein